MDKDPIILINNKIKLQKIKQGLWFSEDFENHKTIYKLLLNNAPKKQKTPPTIYIYDITYNTKLPSNTILSVNDHINRIGTNPFIGHQRFFNIDFINVENLYQQSDSGIITNCCGTQYEKQKKQLTHCSTNLANIATLAYVCNYKVKGFLVNQH